MSKNKLLVLAVAAALAAPSAFAAEVVRAEDDANIRTVNSNQFDTNTDVIEIEDQTIAATASDNYLGRTVGYNVRVRLTNGRIANGGSNPFTVTGTGGASASLVTGTGADGSTEFVVRVVPGEGGTQVGEGFTISGLEVDGLQNLGDGGTVGLEGSVFDPTTGVELQGSSFSEIVVNAIQGVSVAFTPTGSPSVIDVGQNSGKRFFTPGSSQINSGVAGNLFNAGQVVITNAQGVEPWLPATGTADITISGQDFSAFRSTATTGSNASIFLANNNDCTGAIAGTAATATIAANGRTATFTNVQLGSMNPGQTPVAAPYNAYVCFDANGETQIARQDLTGSAVVKPGTGFLNATSSTQPLASLTYNGPVVNVYHFNPASNMDQQSYLRISNLSGIDGAVTIDATCDNGAKRPSTSFSLAAQNSILLTSQELEGGSQTKGVTGIGSCGGGKLRLEVTGEFASMEVQNFLRNLTSVGNINTNVNNED